MDPGNAAVAKELFLRAAAPRLVREVAEILRPLDISVMPLKGALLQRLVYGTEVLRDFGDVDLLVPSAEFTRARRALVEAGFAVVREEAGGWEVILRRPGSILAIDLHQRLSSVARSRLRPDEMFERGHIDDVLFGLPVTLPDPRDLYAHLLLHCLGHWVIDGGFHHPEDFEAVPRVLRLDTQGLADHLVAVGLASHAALLLPLIAVRVEGGFTRRLLSAVEGRVAPGSRIVISATRRLLPHLQNPSLMRRVAGFLLAPSWSAAARDAIAKRLRG